MTRRRAYVLPVVLLLLTVTGLTAAMVLSRSSTNALTTRRQVDAYLAHHGAMGLQAAVQVWLRAQTAGNITGLLGDDGHAFDLKLEDGALVSVYLESGQGSALADLSTTSESMITDAANVLRTLNASVSPTRFDQLTRAVGPVAVDLSTVDDDLLMAVCRSLTDDSGRAERLYGSLVANRAGATRNTLSQASMDADLTNDERQRLYRVLTTSTELWFITIEIRRGLGTGDLVSRYGGLTQLRSSGTGLNQQVNVTGGFLTWEPLPMDGTNAGI